MDAVLYHCPNTPDLARSIVAFAEKFHPQTQITLGRSRWAQFKNGASDLEFFRSPGARRKKAVLLIDLSREEYLFRSLSMLYWLPKLGYKEVQAIIPFFMEGTMERSERPGTVLTAQTLAMMLSAAPMTRSGPVELITYDIHALSEAGFFDLGNVTVRLKSGIKYLRREVLRRGLKPSYAFPDDGAEKRFKYLFRDCDRIICDKVRVGDDRVVTIGDGDPKDKDIVIVDDLTRSGKTLVECANALRAGGARSVSVYVTHLDLTDEGWELLFSSGFDNVWFTDSCTAQAKRAQGLPGAHCITLAESMANIILEEDDRGDEAP